MTDLPLVIESAYESTENSTSFLTNETNSAASADSEDHDNDNDDVSIYRYSTCLSMLLVSGYASVFLVGLLGNLCVIFVVVRSPRMRSVTNHLIVNLAVVDIVVLLVCVPSNLLSNLIHPWLLGLWACKVTSYLQAVTVAASIQTLVAISVDRCVSICSDSLRRRLAGRSDVRRIIILIWGASLALMSPILLYQDLLPQQGTEWSNCLDEFPSQEFRVVFNTVALFLVCYFAPLMVITVSYLLIYVTVWRRAIPGETTTTSVMKTPFDQNKDRLMQRSKLKVVRMMLAVVSTFFISWGPLYALQGYFLFQGFPDNSQVAAFLQIAFPVAQWLGMTNSCINPILYGLFNKRYRREFRALFSRRQRDACCSSTGTVRLRTQFNSAQNLNNISNVPVRKRMSKAAKSNSSKTDSRISRVTCNQAETKQCVPATPEVDV